MRVRALHLLLGLALSWSPDIVRASPEETKLTASSDLELARELFREGVKLSHQGDWLGAREKLLRSAAIVPHAATLHNLALCAHSLGYQVESRAYLTAALRRAARDPSELPSDAHAAALASLRELDSQLVRLELRGPPNFAVSVDGLSPEPADVEGSGSEAEFAVPAEPAPGSTRASSEPLVLILTPGRHEIVLESGSVRRVLDWNAEPGTQHLLTFEAKVEPPAPTTRESAANPEPAVPRAEPGRRTAVTPRERSPVALPAFGVAAVGAVSAVVFGVLALNEKNELDRACPEPSRCPSHTREARSNLKLYAVISDVSLATALIGTGVGIYATLAPASSGRAAPRASFGARVSF